MCLIVLLFLTTWGRSKLGQRPQPLLPVLSGWVISGYLSFPLRKHCGNADKQQFEHVLAQCEGQKTRIPTNYPSAHSSFYGGSELGQRPQPLLPSSAVSGLARATDFHRAGCGVKKHSFQASLCPAILQQKLLSSPRFGAL